MEYSGPWTVKLTYFKSSGKYYSEGCYVSRQLHLFEIFEELDAMLACGTRPGMVDGPNDYFVVVDVPAHPHNHPHLILPSRSSRPEAA